MGKIKQVAHDLYVLDKVRVMLFKLDIYLDWSLMMHYIHRLHESNEEPNP